MRYFSRTEKQIIDYLCDNKEQYNGISVRKLLEEFCECSMQWNDKSFSIYVNDPKEAGNTLQRLIDVICLVEYLRKEGLIYIFDSFKSTSKIINRAQGHTTIEEELPNDVFTSDDFSVPTIKGEYQGHIASFALQPINISINLSKFIKEYSTAIIFNTETLKTIKRNDYKDDATIHHEESTCQTWIAIIVSIAVGVASILIGLHN